MKCKCLRKRLIHYILSLPFFHTHITYNFRFQSCSQRASVHICIWRSNITPRLCVHCSTGLDCIGRKHPYDVGEAYNLYSVSLPQD